MPNWKKVIVSGSDAVLNNVTIDGTLNIPGFSNLSSSLASLETSDSTKITNADLVYTSSGVGYSSQPTHITNVDESLKVIATGSRSVVLNASNNYPNIISGSHGAYAAEVIVNGISNVIRQTGAEASTVQNTSVAILNGSSNLISSSVDSSILAGTNNKIHNGRYSIIGGGNSNCLIGDFYSGGSCILIGNSIVGGQHNRISGSSNAGNTNWWNTIGGGEYNRLYQTGCSIIGAGHYNRVLGNSATFDNSNKTYKENSIVAGRCNDIIDERNSHIIGGACNKIIGDSTQNTVIQGSGNIIGAGHCNVITGSCCSAILGGKDNCLSNNFSAIIGGRNNHILDANSLYSFIGAGAYNCITDNSCFSTITNGHYNCIGKNNCYSTIGGGHCNLIQSGSVISTVGGGACNEIKSSYKSTIVGGCNNRIYNGGNNSAILGGINNCIDGPECVHIVGSGNTVTGAGGDAGTVILGTGITATANSTNKFTYVNNLCVYGNTGAGGTIEGSSITATTGIFGTGTTTINDSISSTGDIELTGSIYAKTDITASGNISSSATVTGLTASFGKYIGIPSSDPFPYTASSGPAIISQSFTAGNVDSTALRLLGSGSVSQSGIFEVEGSAGPLFSVQDGLDGVLMEVNNISGLPLFQVSSSNEVFINRGNLTSGVTTATASFAHFTGSFQGDGSGLTGIDTGSAFPFTGDAEITGSLIVSGSSSPLISLPNAPTNAVIISGSSNRTRLLIHDSGKSNSPLYTEGAGIVLSGGEGSGIQSTLEIAAAGSSNGGNNNEQSFIRSNQQLVIRGNDNDAGDNIKFLGSHDNYGLKFDASTSGVTLTYNTNGGSTVSELNMGNGTYIQANASGTYYKIGRSSTDWLNLSSTKATFAADVSSSSATSTASFGTYIGDGSQLTNLPAASAGSTAGRVVFTTTNGELTSETGFTYDATTDRLTVPNLTTTTFTASFITSSTIETSGSNIFGDEAGVDVQTLVGTTKMTGSAEIDGNTQITGSLEITGSLKMIRPSNKLDLSIGSNIIIGREAGNSISDDRGAIFLGYKAGYTNTNPNANIAIGYGAGGSLGTNASQQNIFMGYLAGAGNTSIGSITSRMSAASNNIGMGYQALLYLTSGDQNIALGAAVMRNISTGGNNTALGAYALYNTDSGDNNIGIGYYAGLNQTSGNGNITIGSGSLGIAGESNQLRIGQGNGDALIHGDFDSGSITFNVSGSDAFQVIGTEGTLFAVDDDLDGTIFSANDRSGLPVLEASASGEVYIGKAPQSLYTTAVISSTTAATTQSIYGLSTSSYGGAFFDYTVQSGSNARAGSIMSVWNGSSLNFTETTTTDIGDTTDFNVIVHISESQAQIASHATRAGYNIKTIIRSI